VSDGENEGSAKGEDDSSFGILTLLDESLEYLQLSNLSSFMSFGSIHNIITYSNDYYHLQHLMSGGEEAEAKGNKKKEKGKARKGKKEKKEEENNKKKSKKDIQSLQSLQSIEYGILLNVEHSGRNGWRVTYRLVNQHVPSISSSTSSILALPDEAEVSSSGEVLPTSSKNSILENLKSLSSLSSSDYYQYYFGNSLSSDDGSFSGSSSSFDNWSDSKEGGIQSEDSSDEKDKDTDAIVGEQGDEDQEDLAISMKEYRVEVDNHGISAINDVLLSSNLMENEFLYEINVLPIKETPIFDEKYRNSKKDSLKGWFSHYGEQLERIKIGDYLWLWTSGTGERCLLLEISFFS
jgi:hypothetical protein